MHICYFSTHTREAHTERESSGTERGARTHFLSRASSHVGALRVRPRRQPSSSHVRVIQCLMISLFVTQNTGYRQTVKRGTGPRPPTVLSKAVRHRVSGVPYLLRREGGRRRSLGRASQPRSSSDHAHLSPLITRPCPRPCN